MFTVCTEAVHGNEVGQCIVVVSVGLFERKQRSLSNSGSTLVTQQGVHTHTHTTLHHITYMYYITPYTNIHHHTYVHTYTHMYITVHHITSHYIILHHSTPPCRHGEHKCITADSDRETQVRRKSGVSSNMTHWCDGTICQVCTL